VDFLQKLSSNTHLTKESDTSTTNSTTPVAQKGNMKYSLLSRKLNGSCWVIDTGAFDHMIGSTTTFNQLLPSDKELIVLMEDGTMSSIMGQGNVYVSSLQLKSVLYVPNLKCNLLSVRKLNKDMDCIVIFLPSHCIFRTDPWGR